MPRHLPIGILAVAHDANVNEVLGVINGVHDTIVADPETPQILGTVKLTDAGRPWICTEVLNGGEDSPGNREGKTFELSSR